MKIIELEEVDSTNEYCKRVDDGADITVTAKRQLSGKGTKGRSFVSVEGGLYISVMRHYDNFPAAHAFKIMVNSCVAVCKTLEKFGITPVIRWSNDILADGKKLSGTLIENSFSGGQITRSVVGIGLNVNNALTGELSAIATSMKSVLKKEQNFNKVTKALIANLQKEYTIESYKRFMPWLGGEVLLKTDSGVKNCRALDISDDGLLVCETDGKTKKISSAEVSLRF